MKMWAIAALLCGSVLAAQSAPSSVPSSSESGTFVLHKFAKAIGKETYTLHRGGGTLQLHSDFLFTDRSSPVPLKADFEANAETLAPRTLDLKGQSSRMTELVDHFEIADGTLMRTQGKKRIELPLASNEFLIDGYSPVAMQQMLMRFWMKQGRPPEVAIPTGSLHIVPAGDLKVGSAMLHGYVINGLIWGGETLWMDDDGKLVALVSTDAEFDHFEAVGEEFEASLPLFIQTAAKNSLSALGALAAKAKQPAARHLLIANVTLIDGTGAPAAEHTNVFVEKGVIKRVSHDARMDTKDTTIIDGSGKFLIPGLWDMHAHYEQVEWGPIYLASGVTSVRDCGNEFDFITTVRDSIASGRGIGPNIIIAGIVDGTSKMSLGAVIADTPDEARAVVHRYKAAGALQIKIYSSMKPELVPVIAAEAHRLGMSLTGHVPNGMTSVQAVEAGYDSINHIQYPASEFFRVKRGEAPPPIDFTKPEVQRAIAVYKQHGTVMDDTLALYELIYHPNSVPTETFEPGIAHVAPQLAEPLNGFGMPASQTTWANAVYERMKATVAELHKQGIPFVAGTDQAIPGYSLHRELELYVEAGFTPMEALQAATLTPARLLKLDKTAGTVEVGKRADMVLLDADPLADIHNTRRVYKTIFGGAVYDPSPLWTAVEFKP